MRFDNLLVGAGFLLSALYGCEQAESDMLDTPQRSGGTDAETNTAGRSSTTPPARTSNTTPTPTTNRSNNNAGGAPPPATAPTSNTPPIAGTGPMAGSSPVTGTAGAAGAPTVAGGGGGGAAASAAGTAGTGGAGATMGAGACCKDGDCLCHGDPPSAPTNMPGPYKTEMYDTASAGCVIYPSDAEPPFAAVAISDGFGGSGGCGPSQTGQWGPLYASWGIVAMIIHTSPGDQPQQRGAKLTEGIAAFKMENMKSGSPLMGKLAGRYSTSGFSMGGGGTTFSTAEDPMLKSSVAIMAWGPTRE